MEIHACHEKAICSLILESPPVWMIVTGWVQAQKMDPTINQVVTWMESKRLDAVKAGDGMSRSWSNIWGNGGKLCFGEGVLYQCSNQARLDHNKLQLVVPQEHILEAMCGAHNDVGHLSLEWMLDICWDQFYWQNLEDDATHHTQTCKCCLSSRVGMIRKSSTHC